MTPKRTLRALKASRVHWQRMHDGKERKGEKPNSDWCALCCRFMDIECCMIFKTGEKCPVHEHTGTVLCDGSPYLKAHSFWHERNSNPDAWAEWQAAAQQEIDFLESLIAKYNTTKQ